MSSPTNPSVGGMMLTARRLAFAVGLSLPLAFAAASNAQPAASQGPQSAPPAAAHSKSLAVTHAARLRALLQLRPDQEPALTVFLASMKPAEASMGHEHEHRAAERAMPAPERMERMLAHMDKVRAAMGEKLVALKTFYSQLTPAQQKAFNVLDMGRGHGHQHSRTPGHAD